MKYYTGKVTGAVLLLAGLGAQAADAPAAKPHIVSQAINPLQLYRFNDRLNMVSEVKFSDGNQVERWVALDCKNKTSERLYWDLFDSDGNKKLRYYGDRYGRYAPAQPDPHEQRENIDSLCGAKINNSDWVYVEKRNKYDNATLLDVANIQKINDILLLRIGYSYNEIHYDPPYDAPYDLKLENHIYDCAKGKDVVIAGLDVDGKGYITDGIINKAIQDRQADFSNTPGVEKLFKTLCTLDDVSRYKGQGKYYPVPNKTVSSLSGPELPDFTDNKPDWLKQFPIPEAVQNTATRVVQRWAEPKFTRIGWTEYTREDDKIPVVLDAQPDRLVRRLENYKIFTGQRIMMANLAQLESAISMSRLPSITQRIDTDLRFPLTQGQRFSLGMTQKNEQTGTVTTFTRQCEVTGSGEATEINPAFSGKYWHVDCEEKDEDGVEKSRNAFLTDLNIFLPLARTDSKGKTTPVHYQDVTITR